MTYLLDTNVCIKYLNGKAPRVRTRLQSHRPEDIRVCSVVKGELFAGARKSTDPVRTLARQQAFLALFISLPFDDTAAHFYGEVRAHLELAGTPIGPHDTQIAAIALANGCILITNNTAEFSRVPGLTIEDWEV